MEHTRAFISYSHDSSKHDARVLAFASALRHNGIDTELDQFHHHEILDWPRWCGEQIDRDHSDFVVCVCTLEYFQRIEGRVPPGKGKGVHWEGSLLDDEVYDQKGNRRILPILFNDEPEASIPRFLRGWTFCRVCDFALTDHGYEQVLRILTQQARVLKNHIGDLPVFPPYGPIAGLSGGARELSSAANYVQLGYDLRYISTLQTFMPDKVSEQEQYLKTLAEFLRLKAHGAQRGDELISYYFGQVGLPLRRDAFNLGFFLAQIEVGRMISAASGANEGTLSVVTAGMAQATRDLRDKLEGFGAADLLDGFAARPTEQQVCSLKSGIKNRLRTVEV